MDNGVRRPVLHSCSRPSGVKDEGSGTKRDWHQEGLLYVLWCILNGPLVHLCRVTEMSAATC